MATRKPRQTRSKVTVDTIIEAGFIAVASNGTSGTTTRHIADIAGVSVGSLYEYFKNKEEIYDAMAKSFVKEVLDMVKELTPIIVEMELEPLFEMIFYTFRDLLTRDNDRYLICLRYATELKYERYIGQIEMALMEVLMKYMMRHPKYLKVNNLSVTAYISINSSIFNVARHLILPNPQISFDEMVRGLSTMIISYIDAELAKAES
ncbi:MULTISPECIES: TetR/AcrR family transcriptional regulator [Acinetobacter]|uniref:TetR/AcrR family transcriptional regulator n=1 Tax=Acinetobacter thutiue TaxID=2998078 RepID=A0ABT7WLT6_9GAMM|nr:MULTISPECIES: TetR/AcrR family transcriptional regulator [Acinetobacter]MCY6411545.1 TetR/AcrR family transcriptional regulator [Acinetobacter thutiue]MDH0030147.1 TetR/AcrR family transcriptional regulator [Acinetobacter sp. GD04021]MDH0885021.1 TetR/AcrR family transcriptional regulator [Acinetobacter sp. GD03873]MDH1082335.1 TetR/AcrR family transcriptional regulator [Acinetobacter sp. GD03983]MDH2188538.1 TetR/AcrR family transcriptional regulator [Acinetobacter sp. GD03645]